MLIRPRRLRASEAIRNLASEVDLNLEHLIQPYFLHPQPNEQEPIQGFTNISRWGVDSLSRQMERDREKGVKHFLLFGHAIEKNEGATESYDPNSLIPKTVRSLRERFGKSVVLFSDVCLCPYTVHGHCGHAHNGYIDNDSSVTTLAKMAVTHAQAGIDFVAPSDMMDGRIGALREALDEKGFLDVGILAYTAKYASSYYGPFREALDSSPKEGDRSTYQMDFRRQTEALQELELDLSEGADMVMVKPALAYLDVIQKFRERSTVPVVAYSVSGEYEAVKRLAAAGMADERKMVLENLTAIRRAGAHAVITYFASPLAEKGWLS